MGSAALGRPLHEDGRPLHRPAPHGVDAECSRPARAREVGSLHNFSGRSVCITLGVTRGGRATLARATPLDSQARPPAGARRCWAALSDSPLADRAAPPPPDAAPQN